MTPRAEAALRGDLSLLPPEILVQMLAMAQVTGCLRMHRQAQGCELYLREGRITYARLRLDAAPDSNESTAADLRERVCDALSTGLAWREGEFAFERDARVEDVDETLDADPQELLLDCLSRLRTRGGGDEEKRV